MAGWAIQLQIEVKSRSSNLVRIQLSSSTVTESVTRAVRLPSRDHYGAVTVNVTVTVTVTRGHDGPTVDSDSAASKS